MSATDISSRNDFLGYRPERLIGQGGMGVVYRARDLRLRRTVALKLMAPELAVDARFRERFEREAELAMSLEHPNVVPIHDAGEVDGRLYLVMRLVEGTDLRSLLRAEGALEPRRTLAIVAQVAEALDAAHAKGLVHRDVKPSNVLLDSNEHVYLADFGLTRPFGEGGAQPGEGRSLGTPAYLAPEQIEGDSIDGRTDVYSLGCLLFECLTGEPPFSRSSRLAIAWAHLEEDPPRPSGRRPELPEALDAVVQKAMAKEPERRYETCAELVAAAEAALALGAAAARDSVEFGGRATRISRRVRLVLVAGGVLLAAAAAAVLFLLGRENQSLDGSGVGVLDPRTGKLVDAIGLGTAPASIAIGERSAWILDADDRTVTRVDPRRGTVLRTFSIGTTPTALAAGGGAVWIGNGSGSFSSFPVSVSRLDPESGRVDATIRLPGGATHPYFHGGGASEQLLAVSDDALWAVNPDLSVSRIDAQTNRLVATITDVRATSIAARGRQIWIVDHAETGTTISQVDPTTNSVSRRVAIEAEDPAALAIGAGAVWAADPVGGGVLRVGLGPKPAPRTIPLDLGVTWVAFGEGAVWATNEIADKVYRIDPRTNRAQVIGGLAAPTSIAVGEERVLVTASGPPSAENALPRATCSNVHYGRSGTPRVLIVSDLPLQSPRWMTRPMVEAIRFVLARRGFRAGAYTVGYQSCDDSTAQAGGVDIHRCFSNAKAYARTPDVVGVIGAFHSFCSSFQIPIANQAPDGPLAMISPSNTITGLTRPYRGMEPGELEELYPTGERNYVRIAAADHLASVAFVEAAKQLGRRRLFLSWDRDDEYIAGFAADMREAAQGLEVVGSAAWNPHAHTFGGFARRIASAKPQAVLMAGAAPPHVGALLRDVRAAVGSDVALIASDGFAGFSGLISAAGRAASGMYVGTYGVPNERLPAAGARFLREFEAARGGERTPDFSAAYAAQAAEILLDAIARSDGTRRSVTRELRRTTVEDGILGDIRFDEYGDVVEGPFTIYRIMGKRVVVDRVVTATVPTRR